MNNFFVAKPARDLEESVSSRALIKTKLITLANRAIHFIRPGYSISVPPDPVADMTTAEQRINYFHLLDAVIANDIPGDVIELGCFTGQCALLFQQVIQLHQSSKELHLYDSFEIKFMIEESIESVLLNNFVKASLPPPILHKGYFQETLPSQLPQQIAFAHIDCGFGGDPLLHKDIISYCLRSIYPRLSKGAVCVLMDYYDPAAGNVQYGGVHPGVKLACDEFLHEKPEKMVSLYGNQYAHGFFRKV